MLPPLRMDRSTPLAPFSTMLQPRMKSSSVGYPPIPIGWRISYGVSRGDLLHDRDDSLKQIWIVSKSSRPYLARLTLILHGRRIFAQASSTFEIPYLERGFYLLVLRARGRIYLAENLVQIRRLCLWREEHVALRKIFESLVSTGVGIQC